MNRRILFIGTVMMVTYGFLFLLLAAICVPVGAFMIFFVPALIQMGHMQPGSFFLNAVNLVVEYWWLVLPPAFAVASLLVTRHLSRRWNGIVVALNG